MLIDQKILISTLTVLVAAEGGHLLFWLFLNIAKIKPHGDSGTGKWLGYFERSLVALFVCLGLISQTVFIFAVKAAVLGYRLPNHEDNRKNIAEYMLLGTMISYFVALLIGLIGLRVIKVLG